MTGLLGRVFSPIFFAIALVRFAAALFVIAWLIADAPSTADEIRRRMAYAESVFRHVYAAVRQ